MQQTSKQKEKTKKGNNLKQTRATNKCHKQTHLAYVSCKQTTRTEHFAFRSVHCTLCLFSIYLLVFVVRLTTTRQEHFFQCLVQTKPKLNLIWIRKLSFESNETWKLPTLVMGLLFFLVTISTNCMTPMSCHKCRHFTSYSSNGYCNKIYWHMN